MSENVSFTLFGKQHLCVLTLILSCMILLPILKRRGIAPGKIKIVAYILAGILLIIKIGEPIYRLSEGEAWQTQLPIQMCDIGAFLICIFLFKQKKLLFELSYFWALGGGIQAALTPDLKYGFPHTDFLFFFITHGLAMIYVIYAVVMFEYRPYLSSILRTFYATIIFALLITPVNLILDENYLFLRAKPEGQTLLSFLGPWPWYIVSLTAVSLIIFFVYYSPFLVQDLIKKNSE